MNKIYSNNLIVIILFLLTKNIHTNSESQSISASSSNQTYGIKGSSILQSVQPICLLHSVIPIKLKKIIKEFNDMPFTNEPQSRFQNRLILFGPPGNGKTTLAKYIAQSTE